MSTQPLPGDQIALLSFRVEALERSLTTFNQQLSSYVRERENDLKLEMLRDTSLHIVEDVKEMRKDIISVEESVKALRNELLKKDADQNENRAQLQIRVLVGFLSAAVALATSILVGYVTHLFH